MECDDAISANIIDMLANRVTKPVFIHSLQGYRLLANTTEYTISNCVTHVRTNKVTMIASNCMHELLTRLHKRGDNALKVTDKVLAL